MAQQGVNFLKLATNVPWKCGKGLVEPKLGQLFGNSQTDSVHVVDRHAPDQIEFWEERHDARGLYSTYLLRIGRRGKINFEKEKENKNKNKNEKRRFTPALLCE